MLTLSRRSSFAPPDDAGQGGLKLHEHDLGLGG